MNLWGPPVSSYFRGWRRARHRADLAGPPARTASSTTSWSPRRCRWSTARIGAFAGSDHRPVVVTLAIASALTRAGGTVTRAHRSPAAGRPDR